MKRRLNIACALVHEPELLLLDEPTAGVDPQSRNAIFETLEGLKREGKALIYTTHYMEEAERLADRIVIVDQGKVIAEGSLPALLARLPASQQLLLQVATKANRDVELAIARGGQTITVSVRPEAEGRFEVGTLGVMPDTHPIVDSVIAGGPAEKAGLKAKDEILSFDGEPMVFRSQLITAISENAGRTVEVTVQRGNETLHLSATPARRGSRGTQ